MAGWGILFLFVVSLVKRSSDLRAEVERLKKNILSGSGAR
jgi:hypothetical protein